MPNDVTIRRAIGVDADELARLRWVFSEEELLAGTEEYAGFLDAFRRFRRVATPTGQWTVWVAERDRRLIGNVWVQHIVNVPRPGQPRVEYGYVTNVFVEAGERGRGVGAALLRAAIRGSREHALEFLIVCASEESRAFYERLGFHRSREAMELELDTPPVTDSDG